MDIALLPVKKNPTLIFPIQTKLNTKFIIIVFVLVSFACRGECTKFKKGFSLSPQQKKNTTEQMGDPSKQNVTEQVDTLSKQNTPPPLAENTDYQIKSGDTIEISVWGEEMDRTITVRPDGKISYILIGEIYVVGKTFGELKIDIEQRLSKYIIEPYVSIIGKSFEGNFVSILGAVESPGRKIVGRNDRVLDVITKANGLLFLEQGKTNGDVANLRNAYLSRQGKLIPVNFSKLIYSGDMSQNIQVQIGDFIYIPSAFEVPIFITGEVYQPTSMPFRGQPTLLEAITTAGGCTTQAKKTEVYIISGGMNSPKIFTSNYSLITMGKEENRPLEPGDIIYVPPTTITRIERLSTQVIPFLNTIIQSRNAKDSVQTW